jgi:hypothetical protein
MKYFWRIDAGQSNVNGILRQHCLKCAYSIVRAAYVFWWRLVERGANASTTASTATVPYESCGNYRRRLQTPQRHTASNKLLYVCHDADNLTYALMLNPFGRDVRGSFEAA